jgi:hypothetical protein
MVNYRPALVNFRIVAKFELFDEPISERFAEAGSDDARDARLVRRYHAMWKGNIMKTKFVASALIVGSGLVAGSLAFAEGLTREQVKAELEEAVRTGDITAYGDQSRKLNELYPHLYPAKPMQAGLTRELVRAELEEAIRSGDIMANGDQSRKLNELYPDRYPAKPVMASRTREEVKAELAEAVRTGDIIAFGEQSLKLKDLYPHRYPSMDEMSQDRHSSK